MSSEHFRFPKGQPRMKKSHFSFKLMSLGVAVWLSLPVAAQSAKEPDTSTPAGSRYFSSGTLQQQIEQSRSRRTERSFYPSGVMQRELVWAMNASKHVLERDVEFASSGVMLREKRWANGEPVSDLEFSVSGMLISSKLFTDIGSTRELLVQDYFSSGVLASEQRFAAPLGDKQRPIGAQKKFDTSGRLIGERVFDEQGKLISEKTWNVAGELMPLPTK
jgi:antitoxin component YwqK of YwqJK toxin-antitoxin module